jgi:hypothetical protein
VPIFCVNTAILGITPIGRATIDRLVRVASPKENLNDDFHDDGSIQRARRLWIRGFMKYSNIDIRLSSTV